MKLKFFLIIIFLLPVTLFAIKHWPSIPTTSTPSVQQPLKLYSLDQNNTLIPPKTSFKAQEPPIFVLTFEKASASLWPFVKPVFAQETSQGEWKDETQTIKTWVLFNRQEAKDLDVVIKPLDKDRFSFYLLQKSPGELHPGQYSFNVERAENGQIQTLTQDFSWGVLAVNPNKSVYTPGEVAKLGIGVLDNHGRTICNASVTLQITDPQGIITVLPGSNGQIQQSGQCQTTSVTNIPDYSAAYQTNKAGVYKLHLEANNGNGVKSLDDSFEVRDSVPFDIERTSYPMRIYPPAEYQAKITVKANQDFKGIVEERVPGSFEIRDQKSKIKTTDQNFHLRQDSGGQAKLITWEVDWKKGESHELDYSIKFPNISPEFYLVGPLSLIPQTSLASQAGGPTSLTFQEARSWQIASDATATQFMESGSDATQGTEFWTSATGTVTSDTTVKNTGPRSIKLNGDSGNAAAFVRRDSVLADAGTRISTYFNFTNLPSGTIRIIDTKNSGGSAVIDVKITSAGLLTLGNAGTNCGSSGSTLSKRVWYRLTLSYTITSSTSFSAKLFVNGVQDIAITNSNCTLTNTGAVNLQMGWISAPGANNVLNIDDVYIDNGTGVDDPGDIRVTAKLPASDNSCVDGCPFDTTIGTTQTAGNRYKNVNERPLSITNGWRQNATTQVRENYGIQAISAGDVDFSSNTQVAYAGWIDAATSASDTAAAITVNGVDTTISTTTAMMIFTSYVDSATYPTNAAAIGMLSTGTANDTILNEAGILFAYKQIPRTKFQGVQLKGIKVK